MDAVPRLVRRAVAEIAEGYLDHASVDDLGAELGVSARQLRRALEAELGVSPIELAQTRRLAQAKQLLHDSSLSLTAIAFASGFGSVRRFNQSVLARFGRSPSAIRAARGPKPGSARSGLVLRLDHRPPLEFAALLEFLAARVIPGLERVEDDSYFRVIGEDRAEVRVWFERGQVWAELDSSLASAIPRVVAGLRRLFDLDAEPQAIAVVLRRDPLLAPLLRRRPGLRVPGSFDPFETAVRAVLGQQVSVAAATTLAGRLVGHFGAMPTPSELAAMPIASLAGLGLPSSRARALTGLADAWQRGAIDCGPGADPDRLSAALVEIPGIGPWTAAYLCMRALHAPDALPASDLVLRKALAGISAREVERRAEAWRPWRAYAALHLWTALGRGELP